MYRSNNYFVAGGGMIAQQFILHSKDSLNICIYAAGVSNSACDDSEEFDRDRLRLRASMANLPEEVPLVYVSTCSIDSNITSQSRYIQHKIEMESIALSKLNTKVVRLPQVAGFSSNPHTLLNYIFNCIKYKKSIDVWKQSTRNIIDVKDVQELVLEIFSSVPLADIPNVINIANPRSINIIDLLRVYELVLNIKPIVNIYDCGEPMLVDTEWLQKNISLEKIGFDNEYEQRIVRRYYGSAIA